MNSSYVNGLELPSELVALLSAGRWKIPNNVMAMEDLGIEDVSDLEFLSLPTMTENTNTLRQMVASGQGELFGLVSGRDITEAGVLDVTKAVMIAATRGQEALCLDYSAVGGPRVVVTHYGPGHVTWVEVARTFSDLLDIIKLP
jgi:hypothetical protein